MRKTIADRIQAAKDGTEWIDPRRKKPEESPKPPNKKAIRPTAKNLERLQQQWYLENIAKLVGACYPQLIDKIKDGNVKALEMGLKVANILKPDNGISVVTNLYNRTNTQIANVQQGDRPEGIQSFESILRRLELQDASDAPKVIEGSVAQ